MKFLSICYMYNITIEFQIFGMLTMLCGPQYGPPGMDGERVHTGVHDEKQGVSVSMNLCIPFADGWSPTVDNKPRVVITDLRFALTSKFMVSWFGQSTV